MAPVLFLPSVSRITTFDFDCRSFRRLTHSPSAEPIAVRDAAAGEFQQRFYRAMPEP